MNRLLWCDNLKAFAIAFVVLGHCRLIQEMPMLFSGIYAFHMPLFFIISGFFVKECQVDDSTMHGRKMLIINELSLVIPYLVTCFLISVYMLTCRESSVGDELKRVFWASGTQGGPISFFHEYPTVAAIWFLPALAVGRMLYGATIRQKRRSWMNLLIASTYLLLAFIAIRFIRLPLSFLTGCSVVIFLYVGNKLRKFDFFPAIKTWILLLGGFIALWLTVKAGFNVASIVLYGHFPLGLVESIAVSIAIICLTQRYCNFENKVVSYIGRNTLTILCIHTLMDFFLLKEVTLVPSSKYFLPFEFLIRFSYILVLTFLWKKIKDNFPYKLNQVK